MDISTIFKELHLASSFKGSSFSSASWQASSIHKIDTHNPATEEILATISLATQNDVSKITTESHQAFLKWRTEPAPYRGEIIRQLGILLREKKEALAHLVSLEMGKSLQEGLGEVQEMIDIADFAVGLSRTFGGKTLPSERKEHRLYEQWHPLGSVFIITAFNFPVAVWAWNAFIAAVCGNTVIWKPSLKTPLCAIAVQNLCNIVMKKNNCEGLFSIMMPEHHDIVKKVISEKSIGLVSFTGSTEVGRKINEWCAPLMKKVLLECGGNNALILDESANLKLAIPAIVFGSVGTSGQRCTTTRRLLIHEKIYDEVIRLLKNAYAQIKIGNPLDCKNHMGPLIDKDAVKNFEHVLHTLKAQGAKIIYGGKKLNHPGYFVEPTLVEAQNEWPLVQQETFAPILYLMQFNHLSQAILLQNQVMQGLSSALFTNHLQHAELFLSGEGSDCGIANINIGTSGAEIGGAFGGEKETGGGREAGSDAWKSYMRRQTNTINWGSTLPLAQGIRFEINMES